MVLLHIDGMVGGAVVLRLRVAHTLMPTHQQYPRQPGGCDCHRVFVGAALSARGART
jgi:hypothetical protein